MSTTTRPVPATAPRTQDEIVTRAGVRRVLALARVVIGFTFLWAFLDKLFGLGYSTPAAGAWINGGTPAQGYISGIDGPFAGFFGIFANPFGDALFMVGLAAIGIALIAGAGLRIAAVTGTLLMLFMFMADLPAATAVVDGDLVRGSTNPIVDSHWHEALLLIIPAVTLAGDTWGAGRWWARTPLVRRHRWLR
ncbi:MULTISPECIES: DoxX family protein [unclassified Pseudactinotalea]|uniref:DoxX family protein n=1 Tax=unclassified Pseudactinotalea TaxID=2649176 RepID=UPI00128BD405|nr:MULTISPECIES: DoxX family protein [unclassified Pseudactinotalea]MPV49730.1 DoxX family protein [Pseudactinotalea sp. HY160]QGH69597.1 DoxX family protein [Pseudactinotalea sp. HY158]